MNVTGQTTLGYASTTQIGSTGSAYFATASGNVGIGTTGPGATLHVVGSVGAIIDGSTGADTQSVLTVRRSDVTTRFIKFYPSYNNGSEIVNRFEFGGGLRPVLTVRHLTISTATSASEPHPRELCWRCTATRLFPEI